MLKPIGPRWKILQLQSVQNHAEAQSMSAEDNLLDAVYNYINEVRYPVEASADKKRSVRRKAKKFAVENGKLF